MDNNSSTFIASVAGNFLGGFGVTFLWFMVDAYRSKKKSAIAFDRVKVAARQEISRASRLANSIAEGHEAFTSGAPLSVATLSSIVRTAPEWFGRGDVEIALTSIEYHIDIINNLRLRLAIETSGIAAALRGNEDSIEILSESIRREALELEKDTQCLNRLIIFPALSADTSPTPVKDEKRPNQRELQ